MAHNAKNRYFNVFNVVWEKAIELRYGLNVLLKLKAKRSKETRNKLVLSYLDGITAKKDWYFDFYSFNSWR